MVISRAQETRRSLLDAATRVFTQSGYDAAAVADIVVAADASVGSLYHHFGGKADLFVALYEEFNARQEARSAAAVQLARTAGERDPGLQFMAGARAYLLGCWTERDIAQLVHAGDGPPGLGLVIRQRTREWTRRNHSLLHVDDDLQGDTLVLVLTTVVTEAAREVASADDEATATRLTDEVLGLMAKIVAG